MINLLADSRLFKHQANTEQFYLLFRAMVTVTPKSILLAQFLVSTNTLEQIFGSLASIISIMKNAYCVCLLFDVGQKCKVCFVLMLFWLDTDGDFY